MAAVLAILAVPFPARGQEGEDDEPETADCRCEVQKACYHYLRAPVSAPSGECWCPKCDPDRPHGGDKVPRGWNPLCFASKNMDAFLRRHAASWKFTCSACLSDPKPCSQAHPELCPQCQEGAGDGPWRKGAFETAEERVKVEKRVFDKSDPIVIFGRKAYVVTDVDRIKILCQGGGLRVATGHEYAHIMAMRAETALREFSRSFGSPRISKPVGVFLPSKETTARKLQDLYFRNPDVAMVYSAYGSASESAIAGGYCLNGCCVNTGRFGNDDRKVHQAMRHMLGHIFVTTWIKQNGENRTMPRWAFIGVGHWLGKRGEGLEDESYYCQGEDHKISGSGKDWMLDLVGRAKSDKFTQIQELLDRTSLGMFEFRDHQQLWGYFEIAMKDRPKEWSDLIADLRREVPVREAFEKRLGMSPEAFHDVWKERVLGLRDSIVPGRREDVEKGSGAPTLANLATESDPVKAAALIRSLGPPADAAHVGALLSAMAAHDSDLVRETAYVILLATESPEARTAVWQAGLAHDNRFVRGYVARVCRELKLAEARDALRKAHDDSFWLVRAEAAMASAAIRDFDSQARLRDMLGDTSPKARIGATDALVMYGEEGNRMCVPLIVNNLTHSDWQVRIATCQALAALPEVSSVEPLIERMEKEAGRVAEEIRKALEEITGDDLGDNPEHWRKWWEKESGLVKERGGFIRTGRKDPTDGGKYAEQKPTYYGVRLFSASMGFVFDMSRSTNRNFNPSPSNEHLLKGRYQDAKIYEIIQEEIALTLAALDPRTRIQLVSFASDVQQWKGGELVQATPGNRDSAAGFCRSRSPSTSGRSRGGSGETNFHGALLAALDLDEGGGDRSGFGVTPDTMLFLTDGTPTVGDITDADVLLHWYTAQNRYARIRTHVFAFGALGVDEDLLQRMALWNGGQFVQVREKHP